jgi:WD40 repeat protein
LLFRELLAEPATRELAERLRQLCRGDYAHVPPLEEFLDLETARPAPVVLIKSAQVAILNRLFGERRPASRGRAARGPKGRAGGSTRSRTSGGMRSWKLRRAVAQVAVAFSKDGRLVVTADADTRVWVRDAATGRTRYSLHLPPRTGHIGAIAFDRRGKVIAAVVHGSRISIRDVSDGRWRRELLLTRGGVQGVALSADARYLAATTDGGTLRCWSLTNGRLHGVASLAGGIVSLAVSAKGRWMASVGARSGVQLRELPGGRLLRGLATGGGVSRVAASGTLLAGLWPGGQLVVWEVATGDVRREVELATGKVSGLALAPNGERVAFVAEDGSVAVRMLNMRGRGSRPAHSPRPGTTRLRPPDWLRDALRRVATAVP